MSLDCKFCKKTFSRERTLAVHVCEIRRRWENKDDAPNRIAFNVWHKFIKYVSTNLKAEKTVDDFIRCRDYLGFVKFANYLIELKPNESENFIDWIFKSGLRISEWQHPSTYRLYIQEFLKKETPERALERTILTIREWEEQTGKDCRDFFNLVAPAAAMNMLAAGVISPWILYSSESAQKMLDRMEPVQLENITKHLDTTWWKKNIMNNKEEAKWINTMMLHFLH